MTTPVISARATSPADVISVVGPILGFEPSEGDIVILGLSETGRVVVTIRVDAEALTTAERALSALAPIQHNDIPTYLLIGYGSVDTVTPALHALITAAGDVQVREVLRVHANRYWSLLCDNPSCRPPEGREFERETATSTTLRVAGLTESSRSVRRL